MIGQNSGMRTAIVVALSLAIGCGSTERSTVSDTPGHAAGIPAGWSGTERMELRTGSWRFYRIQTPDKTTSVREDNIAVRDGKQLAGVAAVAQLAADLQLRTHPDAVPAAQLADQFGMMLVRGSSRRESFYKVVVDPVADAAQFPQDKLHPPETRLDGDVLRHRAWLLHGGICVHLVVEVRADGTAHAEMTEWVPRTSSGGPPN
jgi:hypothetical protein